MIIALSGLVSTILEDDSAELVSGGENGLVNVSLSNTATSSFVSTFVELIGEFVASMFGEVLGEGASLSMEVEEEASVVSGGGRFAQEFRVRFTALGGLEAIHQHWLKTANPSHSL
ncbi:hypothetical protein Tco_1385515 [Tanacetum coccineum]